MTSKVEADDDSFIVILSTTPGASLTTVNSNENTKEEAMNKSQLEDAMKDLSLEANMAFKAQFSLLNSPSPASMMVASTLITDDRSAEELQKRFGELLDENVVLKETLKQNNDSMKEQFMLISSCQEDMLKTHKLHNEKFNETRELVEMLRRDNKKLKFDLSRLANGDSVNNSGTGLNKSGPSSGIEFVTSPDDDTVQKLTSQLELVEKQRRQLTMDNDKLSWQKESLEHLVDTASKERDFAKDQLKKIELELSSKENDHSQEVEKLHLIITDLQDKLKSGSNITKEEMAEREAYTQKLEGKVKFMRTELQQAQIKILDFENIKLDFSQHKSGTIETIKLYKEQIQDLNKRIKEMQKTIFQPVQVSTPANNSHSDYTTYMSNVKLYDRTLKHLSESFNALTNGLSDSLVHTLGIVSSLLEFKLEKSTAERVSTGLSHLRDIVEKQHTDALNNIVQVRSALTIFEGIFKDYNEILKKSVTRTEEQPQSSNVEQLTAALLARAQEAAALQERLEHCHLLRAQLDLYRSDFEAERASREQMASEKEVLSAELRGAQRKVQELSTQLEGIRIPSPGVRGSVTTNRRPANSNSITTTPTTPSAPAPRSMTYTCPKCAYSNDQYEVMEVHFNHCLDDF